MEISAWEIYWLFQLDSIISLFGGIGIISGFTVALSLAIYFMEDRNLVAKKVTIISSVILFVSLLLATLTPSTKTVAAIYVIPPIINDKDAQKIPQKILDLANQRLDELLLTKKK